MFFLLAISWLKTVIFENYFTKNEGCKLYFEIPYPWRKKTEVSWGGVFRTSGLPYEDEN